MKRSKNLLLIIIIIIGILIFIRLGQVIYILNQNDNNEIKNEEINKVEIIPNTSTTSTTTSTMTTTKIITTTKPITEKTTTKPPQTTTTTTTTTTDIKERLIKELEFKRFSDVKGDKKIYRLIDKYSKIENNAEYSCAFTTIFSFETLIYESTMTCSRINDNNIVYELYVSYGAADNTSSITEFDAYGPVFISAYVDKDSHFVCSISDCYEYQHKLLQLKGEFLSHLENANVSLQELRNLKK